MKPPVYDRWGVTVHQGDCLDVLRGMEDESVHAVVTDPPAGVAFMGKKWDSDMGGRHSWVAWLSERMAEAYRVLKPGGHALVWAMPRTSHWTAWALEDAGFEVRDCIVHLFGAGFPKSLDVGKAIDKARRRDYVLAAVELGLNIPGNNLHDWTKAEHSPGDAWWERFKEHLSPSEWQCIERQVVGTRTTGIGTGRGAVAYIEDSDNRALTAPATDAARQWEGWGTALKPSAEHWWLCRKPLGGTVAASVLEHGTGALNIDGCRVDSGPPPMATGRGITGARSSYVASTSPTDDVRSWDQPSGRWPPNTVLSHAALLDPDTGEVIGDACAEGCVDGCPVAELDAQSAGMRAALPGRPGSAGKGGTIYSGPLTRPQPIDYGDSGGASRFFPQFRWEAKAPTAERPRVNGQAHPTVKPVSLMRWMTRLVTPPGGTVLDCFAGTGTTGHAARAEGFQAILIERDPGSIPLIVARLDARPKTEARADPVVVDDEPLDLFSTNGEACSCQREVAT